jgi:hypothetical protein
VKVLPRAFELFKIDSSAECMEASADTPQSLPALDLHSSHFTNNAVLFCTLPIDISQHTLRLNTSIIMSAASATSLPAPRDSTVCGVCGQQANDICGVCSEGLDKYDSPSPT